MTMENEFVPEASVPANLDVTQETPTPETKGIVETLVDAVTPEEAPAPSPEQAAEGAPTPRTMEVIQKEYQQTCFMAGDQQYQMKIMGENLDRINAKLKELNNEAAQMATAQARQSAEDKARAEKIGAEKLAAAQEKRARKAAANAAEQTEAPAPTETLQ